MVDEGNMVIVNDEGRLGMIESLVRGVDGIVRVAHYKSCV